MLVKKGQGAEADVGRGKDFLRINYKIASFCFKSASFTFEAPFSHDYFPNPNLIFFYKLDLT